ncbi:MAG: dicarboxylate/amino acid:cation symporter [Bacteroidales bacterium]|nr:dicarboxylate/amino acid:cation symporter [Bacteroidales bacterium]
MKLTRLPLHWLILAGLAFGIVFGLIAVLAGWNEFTNQWISPFGTIFIRLLKLIAIPLIIVSLINGVSGLNDISRLTRIGLRTIVLYLFTTVMAVSFGLVAVNLLQPGHYLSDEKSAEFRAKFAAEMIEKPETQNGPLQFLVDIVPENIIQSMSANTNMLQVIFFSLLFGVAMVMLPNSRVTPVKQLIEALNDIVMKIVDIIMMAAPFGVFALIASITTQLAGDNIRDTLQIFGTLGMYALTVIIGLVFIILVFYPLLLKIFTQKGPFGFFKGIAPAQLLAFSTSSSAATLPVTMECCEQNLGIRKEISSFVLPLGATVNMDGTSLYQAVAAVFLAQIYGMDLTISQQLTIILTATLASIGSAAVPGAGIIMLVIVLNSVGVPTEGIALIFAVDRPLDMLRTVVNITGDCTVASIVSCQTKEIKP